MRFTTPTTLAILSLAGAVHAHYHDDDDTYDLYTRSSPDALDLNERDVDGSSFTTFSSRDARPDAEADPEADIDADTELLYYLYRRATSGKSGSSKSGSKSGSYGGKTASGALKNSGKGKIGALKKNPNLKKLPKGFGDNARVKSLNLAPQERLAIG